MIGLRSTSSRYGAGTQAFHWLTVMLVLGAYVLSKGAPYSLCSAAADGLRRIHETLGMLVFVVGVLQLLWRSEEHTSELQSLMRISYDVFCLKKKKIEAAEKKRVRTN